MREKTYITGHKNPDSDSVCSAIAYADFKNNVGEEDAIPVRLGDINRETRFILDYFDVQEPLFLETLRLNVSDLDFDKISPITGDISLGMALELMKNNNLNSIAVVDENQKLSGIVTVSDILSSYMDVWDNRIIYKSNTQIDNIIDILSGSPVYVSRSKEEFRGKLLVLSMKTETMEKYIEPDDIVICGDREDAQSFALEKEISLMIVTGGGEISEDIIKKAKEKDISLITTPHETFTSSRLIIQSVPVSYVMTKENIVNFDLDDLVEDVKAKMSQTRYRSYPVVDLNNKVVGLISRYHLISSKKKKVILVDHNERRQSIDGLEDAKILEIIDHHRVADVFTGTPIYFRNEPVGSTSTIIASMFFENGRRPSKKIAGILSAAIISDTLFFKSPTSTKIDKIMLKRLEKIADIDADKFAMEMFKEGTSLIGKTPEELLEEDFKVFTINEEAIGISQVYTMDPESLKGMKGELLELMEKKRKDHRYLNFILMLTDIFNESSEMIVVGEYKDIIGKALGESTGKGSFHGPGILSRKKQVIPSITTAIEHIEEFK